MGDKQQKAKYVIVYCSKLVRPPHPQGDICGQPKLQTKGISMSNSQHTQTPWEYTSFPVRLNGVLRNVTARQMRDGYFRSVEPVGAFQKRQGQKVWADHIDFWRQADGSWKHNTSKTILNRCGYRLIGWADQYRVLSRHNSANALKESA